MSVKDEMGQARKLIEEKRYDDARKLLRRINDPQAKRWLKQLDEKYPAIKKHVGRNLLIAVVISLVVVLIVFFTLDSALNSQRIRENIRNIGRTACTDQFRMYSDQWNNCVEDVERRLR